jgi:ubiquitin-protein ligase
MASAQVTRRLLKELRDLQNQAASLTSTNESNHQEQEPQQQIKDLRPMSDDDLFNWRATLVGLGDTAYAG